MSRAATFQSYRPAAGGADRIGLVSNVSALARDETDARRVAV